MIDGRENGCSEEIAISEGKEIINETEANKEKKLRIGQK